MTSPTADSVASPPVTGPLRDFGAAAQPLTVRGWTRTYAYAAPAIGLFVALVLYRILLDPTWVGDLVDDGGYFLMSKNVWHHGLPVLDETGSTHWSNSLSPAVSLLLAPFGALPMSAAVVVERLVVMLSGIAFLVLAYTWMRHDVKLDRFWAGLVLTCTAVSYPLLEHGSAVMSDVPAATAMMGGIVLVRRDRVVGGLGAFAVAAAVRPINLFVLGAVVLWLAVSRRVSLGGRQASVVSAGAAAFGVGLALVLAALTHYRDEFLHPVHGIGNTFVHQAKELTWYPLSWVFQSSSAIHDAHLPLKLVSLSLLGLAVVGARRRRLGFEAVVVCASVLVLLFYRAPAVAESRYLIPLSPLVLAAAAVAVAGRRWARAAGLAVAAVAVSTQLNWYAGHSPFPPSATIVARKEVYRWIRDHVPARTPLLSTNDPPRFQAFLYTGHAIHATRKGIETRTSVVVARTATAAQNYLLSGRESRVLHRNAVYEVVRVVTR